MRRLPTAIAALLLAAALAPPATGAKRPRPDAVTAPTEQAVPNAIQVFNDYVTPARTYASQRAVIHYVTLGVSAPPLNDDDGDGVPDYVERVGDAADTAIAYYERRGFAPILPDSGGPDARPDIYVSRFAAGYFGVSFPAADADGGAFLAVSNWLDPSPAQSLGSLYATVAHELFHLVQFSYFPRTVDPPLAPWVLEGTAAAMETRVCPDVQDIVSSLQLRPWLTARNHALTAQSYGAQAFWGYLDARVPGLLPAYLERLAAGGAGRPARTLETAYTRVTGRPFSPFFGSFARWTAGNYGDRITPTGTLGRHDRMPGKLAPLGIDFLHLSRTTRSVSVTTTAAPGEVALTYTLASEQPGTPGAARRLDARVVNGTVTFTIPPRLARNARFEQPTLVIANGRADAGVAYRVSTR